MSVFDSGARQQNCLSLGQHPGLEFAQPAIRLEKCVTWYAMSHFFQLADKSEISTIASLLSQRFSRTSAVLHNQGVFHPRGALFYEPAGPSAPNLALSQ
jgi:hypothetical protein